MSVDGQTLVREEVLAQLRLILESKDFDASERNKRFLSYIVEKALNGEGDRIKAFSIATSVFGRGADFDAQSDPIVRIEASRLRRALERYYLTSGRNDRICITIPKGSYIPLFGENGEASSAQAEPSPQQVTVIQDVEEPRLENSSRKFRWAAVAAAVAVFLPLMLFGVWPVLSGLAPLPQPAGGSASQQGLTLFVAPFSDENYDKGHPEIARSFTRQIVAGLTRFKDLKVFAERSSGANMTDEDLAKKMRAIGANFLVTGGVTISPDRVRVTVALVDAASGRHQWSQTFEEELTPTEISRIQDAIASQIVQVLAQRYGVLFTEAVKGIRSRPPESLSSYQCVLAFYQNYWRNPSPTQFKPTLDCLERTVQAEPLYAEALSCLVLTYLDAIRNGVGKSMPNLPSLDRMLDLAKRAIELEPEAAHGYRALYLTYWLLNDVPASLETGEKALALNPYDTEIMADIGMRYCLAGQWERGFPLIRRAFEQNPGLPDQFRYAMFLRLYLDGNYQEALSEARRIQLPDYVHSHMALAISYAKLGRPIEARKAVDEILRIDPDYGTHIFRDLSKRNIHPDIIRAIVQGVSEAGLLIAPQG